MGGEVVYFEFFVALFMGLGALFFLIWSIKSGHLDEPEDAKYRFLERDMEDEKPGP